MTDRQEIARRMADGGVRFLLAQFVDLNGSPKVKMVPVEHFEDVLDEGAGFAGAALPGMGQGPHSHDMMARIDLDSYTPVPWEEGLARFASDLFVDGEAHPYCPRQHFKSVLAEARALPAGSRRRLVFAPTKYLDRDFLHQYRIDFQQLPFQIYEAIDRLER